MYQDSAYSRPVYEASPLNRIVEQYGPGKEWYAQNKSVKTAYLTNKGVSGELSCILFSVEGSGVSTSLETNGYYDDAQLYVTQMTGEESSIAYEFKDKLGQVVLTRQMLGSEKLDTYYVYDDFGNLCFVLPPLLSQIATQGKNISLDDLKLYGYQYKYDDRKRCIQKQLPGTECIRYVYDKADRLIFTQDGEQFTNKQWLFTLSDAFGRITVTGSCGNGDISNEKYQDLLVEAVYQDDGTYRGYNLLVNGEKKTLENASVLTVNYYDDYRFLGKYTPSNWGGYEAKAGYGTRYTGNNQGYETKGLLTGTSVALFGEANTFLHTVSYYDNRGRVVQTCSSNHLEGNDKTWFAYSYTNQVMKQQQTHTAKGKDSQTEFYTHTYDRAGRLVRTDYQLNELKPIVLAENVYNKLGQLESTAAANAANLKTSYAYNIRSWTKSIENPNFGQELGYDFSGNINRMDWEQNNRKRSYTFEYDKLSRLLGAAYKGAENEDYSSTYQYDAHGNMKILTRNGIKDDNKPGLIDDLEFTYIGNQVKNITDHADPVLSSASMDMKNYADQDVEFLFNANGAMTQDLNKGIQNIAYNSLNLPQELLIDNDNVKAKNTYMYTATGVKLKVIHESDPKQKESPLSGLAQGDGEYSEKHTTDYVGGMIYEDGDLKRILLSNGYYDNVEEKFYFYVRDHLGNNRLVADASGDITQSNEYYPFGMAFAESTSTEQSDQPYKYNGKELDEKHGLNWYDYSARFYDPALPQFTSVDPLAEKKYWSSPYAYCLNNPLRFIDPDGKDEWEINSQGQIVNRIENKEIDALYMVNKDGGRIEGQSLSFEYGTINQETVFNDQKNESYNIFTINGSDNAKSVFEMVANPDKGTKVEWTFSTYAAKDGNEINQVSTTHSNLREGSGTYLYNEHYQAGSRLIQTTHNHPVDIVYPSGLGEVKLSGDLLFSDSIIKSTQQQFGTTPVVNLYDYKKRKHLPYNANSTTQDFPNAGSPFK